MKILLAEDEAIVAFDLKMDLEDEGNVVVGPCLTLKSCIDAIETKCIDAAILDVDLRGEDVFPAAEILNARAIPFVFHTGHASATDLQRRFPNAPICRKPMPVKKMVLKLENMVDGSSN